MSSALSLRCDLVLSVVRGMHNFRRIELERQLAESLELEARMEAAAVSPDGKSPSPLDILLACQQIQAGWSDVDRDTRWFNTCGRVERWLTPEQALERKRENNRVAVRRYLDRKDREEERRRARCGEVGGSVA